MATEILKILNQQSPGATTLTDFYTVPTLTTTVISSIFICNGNSTDETFRISVGVSGAADNIKQYIYREMQLLSNDTFTSTSGIVMSAGDIMRIYASNTNISFTIFGSEIT